jgi:hypothetical protein
MNPGLDSWKPFHPSSLHIPSVRNRCGTLLDALTCPHRQEGEDRTLSDDPHMSWLPAVVHSCRMRSPAVSQHIPFTHEARMPGDLMERLLHGTLAMVMHQSERPGPAVISPVASSKTLYISPQLLLAPKPKTTAVLVFFPRACLAWRRLRLRLHGRPHQLKSKRTPSTSCHQVDGGTVVLPTPLQYGPQFRRSAAQTDLIYRAL